MMPWFQFDEQLSRVFHHNSELGDNCSLVVSGTNAMRSTEYQYASINPSCTAMSIESTRKFYDAAIFKVAHISDVYLQIPKGPSSLSRKLANIAAYYKDSLAHSIAIKPNYIWTTVHKQASFRRYYRDPAVHAVKYLSNITFQVTGPRRCGEMRGKVVIIHESVHDV